MISNADMLVAMMDSKLVVWYYPNVVFVDRDLTSQTKVPPPPTLGALFPRSGPIQDPVLTVRQGKNPRSEAGLECHSRFASSIGSVSIWTDFDGGASRRWYVTRRRWARTPRSCRLQTLIIHKRGVHQNY